MILTMRMRRGLLGTVLLVWRIARELWPGRDRPVVAATAFVALSAVTVKAEAGQPTRTAMDEEDIRSYREAVMRGPLRPFFGGSKRLARTQQ